MAKTAKKSPKKEVVTKLAGIPVNRIGLLLAVFGTLLYFQTVSFDCTQDDAIVITENMFTKKGISGIPGLLSHDTFYGYFKDENKTRLVSGGRYRPLTPVMFAIEHQIAGPKPWFSHFINAACFGLLCFVIFGFTRDLLTPRLNSNVALHVAAIAALIFAVRPIHTEAVANIKGRDEIVAALSAIGGLWLIIKGNAATQKFQYLALATLVFFLGLFAKENVITMLGVVPLTLWWYNKNKQQTWWAGVLPIIIASALFLLIRGGVTGWEKGETPKELMNNPFPEN